MSGHAPETEQAARDIGELVRIVRNGRGSDADWERAMFRLGSIVALYELQVMQLMFCTAITMLDDSGYLDIQQNGGGS